MSIIKVKTYLADIRLAAAACVGVILPNGQVLGVDEVDPAFLVGILVGVCSSVLAKDIDEPWRDAGLLVGLDVPGVKLDRIGIDVRGVSKVLDGVRLPRLTESDWSESAVEPARDLCE